MEHEMYYIVNEVKNYILELKERKRTLDLKDDKLDEELKKMLRDLGYDGKEFVYCETINEKHVYKLDGEVVHYTLYTLEDGEWKEKKRRGIYAYEYIDHLVRCLWWDVRDHHYYYVIGKLKDIVDKYYEKE